jgi:3-oxoadipate enol-lactonase
MPIVKTRLWDLNYVTEGNGPTVILIHGLAGDHTAWLPQIEALKSRCRVIAIDNPGSGRSSKVTEPTTMAELGQAVLQMMDQLDIDAAHVVGRSMGGAIAQEMALAAPKRVRTLVMAGSFAKLDRLGTRLIENMRDFINSGQSWSAWTRQFSFAFVSNSFFINNPTQLAQLERIIADEARDKPSYVNLANAVIAADSLDRLGGIKCPVLIMAGRLDPICSPTTTDWLARAIPQSETVYFENSSHFFLMEEKDKAIDTLQSWLRRHASETQRAAS